MNNNVPTLVFKRFELFFSVTCLLLLSGGFGSFLWSESVSTNASMIKLGVLSLHYFLGILVILSIGKIRFGPFSAVLLILLAYTFLSTAWSTDPVSSLRSFGGLVGASGFALFLSGRYSMQRLVRMLSIFVLIGVGASLLLLVLMPGLATDTRFHIGAVVGIFPHKNVFGVFLAFSAVVILSSNAKALLKVASLMIVLFLCTASQSVTGIIVIISLVIFYTLLVLSRRRTLSRLTFLALFYILIIVGVITTLLATEEPVQVMNRDTTLSGRTLLWELSLREAAVRPMFGAGFAGFWNGLESPAEPIRQRLGWSPAHSHNGLLEVFLTLGLVGLLSVILLMLVFLNKANHLATHSVSDSNTFPLLFFLLFVLYNLVEVNILDGTNFLWVVFCSLGLLIEKQQTTTVSSRVRDGTIPHAT